MINLIKKSLNTMKFNPVLVLFFIIYLILLSFFMKNMANLQDSPIMLLSFVLILLFNAAFFAGWFAMIKKALEKDEEKDVDNIEEKYQQLAGLKNEFLGAIPAYILPIFATFIIYYLLFVVWIFLNVKFATKFIGSIDFLLQDIKLISQSTELTVQYLSRLPQDKLFILYCWQFWLMGAITLFGVFTIFLPPALYFEKNNSKNPLRAFWNAFIVIFKRPLGIIGFNIFLAVFLFLMMFLANLTVQNLILGFIYLVFSIYAFVFLFILMFAYYKKHFSN